MGILRLFLALCVVAGHSGSSIFGISGIPAYYTVNAFFVISGFYMAMVLNEKYKTTKVSKFYASRALRLYPIYYVGAALALLLTYTSWHPLVKSLTAAQSFFVLAQNLFIFGQDSLYAMCFRGANGSCTLAPLLHLDPPSWSLSVELVFYILSPYILKSKTKTYAFIAVGIIYLVIANAFSSQLMATLPNTTPTTFSYFLFPASFAFFGTGALAYHLNKNIEHSDLYKIIALVFAASYTSTVMPYWHALFFAFSVPVIFSYTKSNKLDRLLGELSFPVYILHMPVIIYIGRVYAENSKIAEYASLGSTVAVTSCLLGAVLHTLIESKITSFRHRLTRNNSSVTVKGTQRKAELQGEA
jgi:peptidoglycan/LPS O-acetylase OafA/YrhL